MSRVLTIVLSIFLGASLAAASDMMGSEKQWGTVRVRLDAFLFDGQIAAFTLLLRNQADKEEPISSLMSFEALSGDGEKGEMQWNATKCDGTIPPGAVLKCRLFYKFPAPPSTISLRVGAGFLTDAVYFNVGR